MLKKGILFVLMLGLCFSIQMEINQIKIVGSNTNKIYPGDIVEIYFLVKNDDSTDYKDVKVYFYPYSPLKIRSTYLNELKFDEFFRGEEKILRFSFKVPENIKPGEYKVELSFEGDDGNEIKHTDQIFYIRVFDHNYFDVNLSRVFVSSGILNSKLYIKSEYPAKHVIVTVEPIQFYMIGNNQFYLKDFDQNETKTVPLKFYVGSLPTGVYKIRVLINWIGQDEMEYSQEKYLNIFIDNKNENNFDIVCNSSEVEKGINKIKCNIINLKNYTVLYIELPQQVLGSKITNRTNFNVTLDINIPGIYSFCPVIYYLDKDLQTKTDVVCYNINVIEPSFNIKILTSKNKLYKNKINNVTFFIQTDKKLNDLEINIDGETIGQNYFENTKVFNVSIKPETKNYVSLDLKWKYKGINYEKKYTVKFDIENKIEPNQLFVFFDNSNKILGVANRGNFKLYHCILKIMKNNSIIKYKYIGDLDEDDYDSTILDAIYGKLNIFVQCYDINHVSINTTKEIYIPIKIKKQNNSFFFILSVILIIGILYLIYKKLKSK